MSQALHLNEHLERTLEAEQFHTAFETAHGIGETGLDIHQVIQSERISHGAAKPRRIHLYFGGNESIFRGRAGRDADGYLGAFSRDNNAGPFGFQNAPPPYEG